MLILYQNLKYIDIVAVHLRFFCQLTILWFLLPTKRSYWILCISHIKITTTFRWQQDPIVDTSRFDQYVILTKFRKSQVAFSVNSVKWKTKIFTGVSAVIGVENRVIYYRVLSICRVVAWSVVRWTWTSISVKIVL